MFINGQVIWRFPPKKKEGEDALQEQGPEGVHAYPPSEDSEEVGQEIRREDREEPQEEG